MDDRHLSRRTALTGPVGALASAVVGCSSSTGGGQMEMCDRVAIINDEGERVGTTKRRPTTVRNRPIGPGYEQHARAIARALRFDPVTTPAESAPVSLPVDRERRHVLSP